MLYNSYFDAVVEFSNSTFPTAHGDGTVEFLGVVFLVTLLVMTTSPHPWIMAVHLSVPFAMHNDEFQHLWKQLATSWSPEVFMFIMLGVAPSLVYWVNGLFLLLLEVKWPNEDLRKRIDVFRERYKIQKGSFLNVVLDGPEHKHGELRVLHVVRNLIIGQACVLMPLAYFAGWLVPKELSMRDTGGELPSAWEMGIDIMAVVIVDEVLFYYGHRLCHESKWLYVNVHKVHHEFQYPCGLVAAYSHPIEMVMCNVVPLGVGLLLFRVNYFTAFVWACTAMMGTQTHHSGYRWPYTLPWDDQPDYHDFHHKEFNTNYGLMTWLDQLHGTDTKYWAYQKQQAALRNNGKHQNQQRSKAD